MCNFLHPEACHHFRQHSHSIFSMGGRLLEKTYHPSKIHYLCTQLRRQKEELWIQKLDTAIPFGRNDKINIICNLYSTRCSKVNVKNIFDNTIRCKQSHGHSQYTPPWNYMIYLCIYVWHPSVCSKGKHQLSDPVFVC
jgi:hypothetical protein